MTQDPQGDRHENGYVEEVITVTITVPTEDGQIS